MEIKEPIADGVHVIAFTHWRDFHARMIDKAMLRSGLIWRGQKKDDLLKPTLDRDFEPTSDATLLGEQIGWTIRYGTQLSSFKSAVAGRRGVNPMDLDGPRGKVNEHDEWWALGQQHGLKTPLLDWTDSPFAALFFAFIEDNDSGTSETSFRYLYALYPLKLAVPEMFGDHGTPFPIRTVHPRADENVRLLSQGGLFTQATPGHDIEGLIREKFKGKDDPVMLKIRIGYVDPKDCLVALNRMGINHRTLFPDLHGATQFANRLLDDREYGSA